MSKATRCNGKRRKIATAKLAFPSTAGIISGRWRASTSKSKNHAKPHLAAVHLFVSLCHLIERILLDHRVDAAQRTKFQGVLRIPRGARIPTSNRASFRDQRAEVD